MQISFILPTKTPTKHDLNPMRKILKEALLKNITIHINQINKDISHYFTWNVGKDLFYKAKEKFPNAKFINLIWDIPQWRIDGKDDYGNDYNWDHYYRSFMEGADILLSASKNTQKVIAQNYNIPSEVFYMFFDNLSLNNKHLLDYLPTINKSNSFKIVGISRLVPSKKFDILINAILLLEKKYNYKIELSLIGAGPEKKNLKDISKKNKIKVNFYQNISRSYLVYLLKRSNLLVAPSILEGDCGWAPCEAIFCNVPTIVSDINVTNEFLKDGTIYFKKNDHEDLANKIKIFLDKKVNIKDLLDKGKKNLSFYTIESFKERFYRFLNQIEDK